MNEGQRPGRRPWGWLIVSVLGLLAALALSLPASTPAEAQEQAPTATPTSTPYVFQDNDPAVRYTGVDWNLMQDTRALGGTVTQARFAGSIMRLQFNGPHFKWYGVRGPNRGFARVSVDGVEIETFDLYKLGEPSYDLIKWQGGFDSERSHTLVIEVLGQRNGASTDTLVAIDAIEVQGADRSPITPTPSITPSPAATATPQFSPTPTPGPERTVGSWPIDSRFLRYYVEHDGLRILGNTISPPTFFAGRFTQYFEKGRMEDHTGESPDPNWQFQYGLLVDELQIGRAELSVGGEQSTIKYAIINDLAQESRRVPPPADFRGGTVTNSDGSVFVPYSQALQPAPGHSISPIFWPYINRTDIFPGGWLHDIGLPMTEAIPAVVTKGTLANRSIFVQVFQRTILTYDPLNPAEFQVERANVGTDYRRVFPDRVPQ
ncbi:MAG: hypothetical protein HY332_25825 [Chloroflexi bacterium]|nr:hypothetical protein [Chloroflexota bacterium]